MVKLISVLTTALALVSIQVQADSADDALMRAIHAGDSAKVTQALKAGATLNSQRPDGSLPLAWAAESQNPALVKLLLDKGAKPDVNGKLPQHFTPLTVACQRGEPTIVAALLDAKADVNRTTNTGISPLALCAGYSSAAIVKRLLELGAKVDAADETGQTPLMWAAAKGQLDSMQLLFDKGADINRVTPKGFTPLFFALTSGNPQAPLALLNAGADEHYVAPDGTSLVQMAIYQQQFAFARELIKRGVDLTSYDRNGNQLLHAAVRSKQLPLVETLLAQGANPNALTGKSAVVWRYEVNFTSRPYVSYAKTPLLLAAELGATDIMRALVAAGADVKFKAEDGTSVVLAAVSSNAETLSLALSLAPDINIANKNGRTALHVLLGYSFYMPLTIEQIAAMFDVLSKQGANINLADSSGTTPLDIAKREDFKAKAEFAKAFHLSPKVKL
ncbi:MAG: ankyrin repeat domain-containing protein [Cellvibrio sp.]|uniref:ankyrin repeat domain-containing protein n=1 Tax=Cellvibrio sp. TaxID=1965322 RepID=UPI0031AA90F1